MKPRVPRTRTLALICALCVGCGTPAAPKATGPSPQVALEELAEVIRSVDQQRQPKPAKLADLKRYEPMAETALAALRGGSVVFLWGAGYQAGGAAVVAYQSEAETGGGLVLLQDGSVKPMTAAEFAAAPKAGKK